jgi:hypothetical protein
MALVVFDRVQETTATTGTGSITLSGAVAGYQSFAVVGNGNTTFYCIVNNSAWEVGIGTYSTTGPTLARTTVLSNSSGTTSPITLVGASNVFVTYPSEKSVNLDASGNVSALGTITSGVWNGSTIPVAYGGTGVTTSSGANSVVLRDANVNASANNFLNGYTATTAAAGTTVLTTASSYYQRLSGSTTQTYKLPDATTMALGQAFVFDNDSSGVLTIVDNASNVIDTVPSGGYGYFFVESNATSAGSWGKYALLPASYDFSNTTADFGTAVIINTTYQGNTVGTAYGGTGLTGFSAANNAIYSTSSSALTAGTLPVAAGGTGITSLTAGYIPYGNGTGAFSSSSNLTYGSQGINIAASNYASVSLTASGTGGRQYLISSTDNANGLGGGKLVLYDQTATAARMVIDSSGNVGIGTTTPTARLTITNGDDARIKMYSNGGSVGIIDTVANGNESTGRWLTINPTGGNVGIGTNPTGYTLQVNGTVGASTFYGALSGNANTATTLTSNVSNWNSTGVLANVVGMLGWKNYGNNHVIFDASNGTSPSGTSVNATNSQNAWSSSYPTLMGWNGANTYGVRVDSSRVSDASSQIYVQPNRTDGAWYQACWSNAAGGDYNLYSTNNVTIYSAGYGGIGFYGTTWSLGGNPSWGLSSNTGLILSYNMAAPIYYDSQDTSFYCDPNGWSLLNSIRLRDNTGYYLFNSYADPACRTGNIVADDFTSYNNVYAYNNLYSQVFYDRNNTGYYLDLNNTSRTGVIIADSPGGGTGACMVNQDNRIGRWIVASGYFEVLIDGSAYGVSFFPSDEKIKKNIVPTTYNALDTVEQIEFKEFDFDPEKSIKVGHVKCGITAQQVQSIDSNLVEMQGDFLTPKLDQMVYVSLKAIQEMNETIKAQQTQIDALIAKVGL